jgi:hypothetical protein
LGSTQAGAAYGIFPTYAQLVSFNARLDQLLTDYQGFADGPGRGQFVDGTMGLPGVSFAADRDTGMRRIESNRAALTAGGADILEFGATGAKLNRLLTGIAITQSSTDVTVGRLMVNGTAGLNTLTPPNLGDLTAYEYPTGFFSFGATAVNGPIVASGGMGIQLRRFGGELEQAAKIVFDDNSNVMYVQQNYGGAKGPWRMVYDTGNIVGTVSFVGGANTGAAFEYFTGPNGQTYRTADGRQVCTNNNAAITTAPAAFVGTITKLDGDKMWTGRWRT